MAYPNFLATRRPIFNLPLTMISENTFGATRVALTYVKDVTGAKRDFRVPDAFRFQAVIEGSDMSYQDEPSAFASLLNPVPFASTGRALARATMRMQAQALKTAFHVQIEALAFAQRRCERGLKLIDDLIDSEKYQNTSGVCGEFYRNAASQYTDETRKLISIGSGITSDAAEHANEEVDKVFEDVSATTITP
ncbi:hypothetical protein [Phyllobacterium sp. SB3]|uniref:hypothetical protein n=1 Tax=Phyllobacterium sp. SB3 TaxID=3156073 RepID=UPI0032AF95DD